MNEQTISREDGLAKPRRPLWDAIWHGFKGACPSCGNGRLFKSFVTTARKCDHCGEAFHHHRADDLPAYLVILIVGHVVVGAFMSVEAMVTLTSWQHLAIWVPITIVACLALLRPAKGAVVGLQWALYMHGFGRDGDAEFARRPEQDRQ